MAAPYDESPLLIMMEYYRRPERGLFDGWESGSPEGEGKHPSPSARLYIKGQLDPV